jgi:enoyl-CoA hydratase
LKRSTANYKDGLNGYDVEITAFAKSFGTADFKEGTSAFLQKRKANFHRGLIQE